MELVYMHHPNLTLTLTLILTLTLTLTPTLTLTCHATGCAFGGMWVVKL